MNSPEIREKIKKLRKKLRKRRQSPSISESDISISERTRSETSPPPPKRWRRIISSDSENSLDEANIVSETTNNSVPNEESLLSLLGEDPTINKEFGDDIHAHVAVRWNNILQKGIKKDIRSELIKKYLPPANCAYVLPPTLNDEIKAAVQDNAVKRDGKLEHKQIQLGAGITCLGKAMDLAFKIPDKTLRDQLIKLLGDGGQIFTDLHYLETITRRSLLMQGLNKNTKDAIKDLQRDKLLFGEGLPEKLKAIKACSRSASDIKVKTKPPSSRSRAETKTYSNNSPQNSTAALNWRGSSRRNTNTYSAGAYRYSRPAAAAPSASTARRPQTSQRPQPAKRS